jgi:hypothetical protein
MLRCVFPFSEMARESYCFPSPYPTKLIIIKILCHCFVTVHSLTNLKMQMNAKLQLGLELISCQQTRDSRRYFCSWKSIFVTWGDLIMAVASLLMSQDAQMRVDLSSILMDHPSCLSLPLQWHTAALCYFS